MYSIRTAVSALALALGLTSFASATTFNFTSLDVLVSLGTVAQDINNAGDIVEVSPQPRQRRFARDIC